MRDSTDREHTRVMSYDEAMAEANRCLHCHEPPCEAGCAAGVPVRSFIRKVKFGDLRGAAEVIKAHNPFGGTCGYVCETSNQCRAHCTMERLGRPIDIAGLQLFVMEWERCNRPPWQPMQAASTGHRVAVVGAGPAGITAALSLHRMGHEVVVYERREQPGGVLKYGIPPARLPRAMVEYEIDQAREAGIRFLLGNAPDREELTAFDAVFLSIGWSESASLDIPGIELDGVYQASEFLKLHAAGAAPISPGDRVMVIGGGNTAMDCAVTAARMGAGEVTVLYRRSEREMPAWERERLEAHRQGVVFRVLTTPEALIGNGRVTAVQCRPMTLGEPDDSGRRRPVALEGGYVLPVDKVLVAAGERLNGTLLHALGLKSREQEIAVDEDGWTGVGAVYAGGDIVGTRKTVVQAVQDGKRAAQAIHERLSGHRARLVFDNPETLRGRFGVNLLVRFCGIEFENPFILAAAPPSDELEMLERGLAAGWAGAVLKTTSVEGTPVPLKYPMITGHRYQEKHLSGMGNIDLISGYHIDAIEDRIRKLKDRFPGKIIIGSMMGATREQWTGLARRLRLAGADLIECSFSCPQGSLGAKPGFMLGQDPELS
ncbi:FAD-dependent oxidoreductase, partial [bacterium]|nr:FAD-dependent oxidoreductase [candidate division CSSED10-310 bacterium]